MSVSTDPLEMLMLGSKQGGIAEAIIQAVEASPEDLRPLLFANIVVVGGTSKLPGFQERLFVSPLSRLINVVREKSYRWPLQIA